MSRNAVQYLFSKIAEETDLSSASHGAAPSPELSLMRTAACWDGAADQDDVKAVRTVLTHSEEILLDATSSMAYLEKVMAGSGNAPRDAVDAAKAAMPAASRSRKSLVAWKWSLGIAAAAVTAVIVAMLTIHHPAPIGSDPVAPMAERKPSEPPKILPAGAEQTVPGFAKPNLAPETPEPLNTKNNR